MCCPGTRSPATSTTSSDLANANKPRNTIRTYRGALIGFAAHHDGEIAGLTAAVDVAAVLDAICSRRPRKDVPGDARRQRNASPAAAPPER
jgi:hypothetical protein